MKCEYEDCGNEAVITGFCEWCCLQGDDEQRAAGEWKIAHDKVKAELAASHKAHAETRASLEASGQGARDRIIKWLRAEAEAMRRGAGMYPQLREEHIDSWHKLGGLANEIQKLPSSAWEPEASDAK